MKNLKHILILCLMIIAIACTKKKTNTSERFYFRTDGADLAVQVDGNVGSKTFIFLLHGGPGGGAAAYNSGLDGVLLEEKYAIVYMDQRGNGASMGNYEKSDLTLTQNSKDIYNLTQFLKKKYGDDISLFLLGHSWGGITSAHALIHTNIQAQLKGWIEVDGAHDFGRNNVELVKHYLKVGKEQIAINHEVTWWNEVIDRIDKIDTNNITDDDEGYMNQTGFKAEGKILDIVTPPSGGEKPFGIINSPDLSLAIAASNRFGNPILNEDSKNNPLTNRLNEIKIPSLFLWGKYDLVVPPALGFDAYNLVSTTEKEIVIFEHSGHSPMANEPTLYVEKLSSFIEKYK